MNSNQLLIYKVEQPKTLNIIEICLLSPQTQQMEHIQSVFSQAVEIVDAQFYYTNPLLFVFVNEAECKDFAELYDGYFFIPPRLYDAIDIAAESIAVNAEFIKQIGSLATISENEARLNPAQDEYNYDPSHESASVFNNIFQLYQEKGLYMIGIRKEQEQGKESNEKA